MRRDDPSMPPQKGKTGAKLPDYERRWNVAIAQLLSYVPFDVVKELRDIGEEWAAAKAAELIRASDSGGLMEEIERQAILAAYARNNSAVAAAKELGIGQNTMYRKLKDYGVLNEKSRR